MANLNNLAGFDVSKNYFDVCLIDEGKESIRKFNYDSQGLRSLIKWLPEATHCIMEVTGPYYLKLACFLHQHLFKVSVINPLVIKRFSQMRLLRAKTDKADARMIASYGLTEQPPTWEPPKAYMIKQQQLDALLHQMQKQRSALLCQKEAFSAAGNMDKEVEKIILKSLTLIDKQISTINKKMEDLVKEHHGDILKRLTTIPGIGKKTAIVLIVITNGFKKFNNYKQLSAYLGLCPRIYQSGSSVKGKARICKMGASRIRAYLYVCAWSAINCNKACKELYERLLSKGKAKRLALIAVANKLLKQLFAIATSNGIYNPNYAKNICF